MTMARYNAWMNTKMYRICAELSDEERKADRGAFFRSIHGTLDHLLAVDVMLLAHYTEGKPTFLPTGELCQSFDELRRRRGEEDAKLLEWSRSLSDEWLEVPSSYTDHVTDLSHVVPRGFWIVHLFNHQTHHRGQITTLLTQLGQDIGSTDLHGIQDAPVSHQSS